MTYDEQIAGCPPIVRAAIDAILKHEEGVDDMGYDIDYYQEDLPRIVKQAIARWGPTVVEMVPWHMPNPTDATDDDLSLACEAIGANARYGGMLSAALAGIYADRRRNETSRTGADG